MVFVITKIEGNVSHTDLKKRFGRTGFVATSIPLQLGLIELQRKIESFIKMIAAASDQIKNHTAQYYLTMLVRPKRTLSNLKLQSTFMRQQSTGVNRETQTKKLFLQQAHSVHNITQGDNQSDRSTGWKEAKSGKNSFEERQSFKA